MALPYIPFVTTRDSCAILKTFYPDATAAHLKLDRLPSLKQHLPTTVPLWIDAGFEGFSIQKDHRSDDWKQFIQSHPHHERFDDPAFLESPKKPEVQAFVDSIMTACVSHNPSRLSIPQMPVDLEKPRFKLNRMLAEAAAIWRAATSTSAELILPLVFTHQTQLAEKTERSKALAHVKSCLKRGQFEGLWSVDASLADQDGIGNFEKGRFRCIIKLFEEVREIIGPTKHLTSGPYWGLNLVLWARGNIEHPAIGLGSTYQYRVHGLKITSHANVRVALGPLRRWATQSPDLRAWLAETVPLTPAGTPSHTFFSHLHTHFADYSADNAARRQVAQFYKEWFQSLNIHPAPGRALALYQDLSSAYVLGKTLGPLPKDERSARRPEKVAQQLMLNCL